MIRSAVSIAIARIRLASSQDGTSEGETDGFPRTWQLTRRKLELDLVLSKGSFNKMGGSRFRQIVHLVTTRTSRKFGIFLVVIVLVVGLPIWFGPVAAYEPVDWTTIPFCSERTNSQLPRYGETQDAELSEVQRPQQLTRWNWTDEKKSERTTHDLQDIINQHEDWLISLGKSGKRAILRNAKLSGAKLEDVKLSRADLTGADLSDSNLTGANLSNADLSKADLSGVNFDGANLRGANLYETLALMHEGGEEVNPATFISADFSGANLEKSKWIAANFRDADFRSAKGAGVTFESSCLMGADLSDMDLSNSSMGPYISPATGDEWSGTVFIKANLFRANLKEAFVVAADFYRASLVETELNGANLFSASLHKAEFEPKSLPLARDISQASGLQTMQYSRNPDGIFQLIDSFKKSGYRTQEREVTFSLKRSEAMQLRQGCTWQSLDFTKCSSFVASTWLFDFASDYGMTPLKPTTIVLAASMVFSVVYLLLLACRSKSAIFLCIKSSRHDRVRIVEVRKLPRFTRSSRFVLFVKVALIFSLISTFNLGLKDVDFGKWLRMMAGREYDLRGKGWFRTLSGFQSLLGFYLIALTILIVLGNPFVQW